VVDVQDVETQAPCAGEIAERHQEGNGIGAAGNTDEDGLPTGQHCVPAERALHGFRQRHG
jgi:hypothetical protein